MNPSSLPRRRRFSWRFGLQSLLVAILLIAVLLAWWRDHVQLSQQIELQEMRLRSLESSQRAMQSGAMSGFGGFFSAVKSLESQFPTAAEYVAYVKSAPESAVRSSFSQLSLVPWADEAAELLNDLLESKDPEQRRRAALAFKEFRTTDDSLIPKLVPLLDDPIADVQRAAVAAIREHGQAATDAVPALERHADSLTSPIAVDALLTLQVILLYRYPAIDTKLIKLLDHEDASVRKQAVRAVPKHVDGARAEAVLSRMFFRETSQELKQELAEAINVARISQASSSGS